MTGEETPQLPRPQNQGGPDFIHKLKDKRVTIKFHNGDTITGVILKFNRYELLFQEDGTQPPPYMVMKNFITSILPMEGNPFEKKPEEVTPCQ